MPFPLRHTARLALMGSLLTALSACATPESGNSPATQPAPPQAGALQGDAEPFRAGSAPTTCAIAAAEYGRIYQAALAVLRGERFVIDRQDYRFGVVTTRPLFVPTLLEPWDRTHTTLAQSSRSTLNQERRLVRVTMTPTADADTYTLQVAVTVQRRQNPALRLEGSTDAPHVAGHLHHTPPELLPQGVPAGGEYWRDLGPDAALEAQLLAAIVRRSVSPQ